MPGSDRYLELGKEMVKIHQDNLIIIGTVGSIPITNVVSNKLGNVPQGTISSYGYGYSYGARADQWYFKE